VSGADRIIIIGAGDHGRGTLEILLAAREAGLTSDVSGFVDDAPEKRGGNVGGLPVLGGLDWLRSNHQQNHRYIIALANCATKQVIAARLSGMHVEYASAIHPTAVLGRGVRIAPGAIVNAGVVIAYDTVISEHTTINLNATIGHDCTVGRYSTIAPGANVAGRVTIGAGCEIGLNAAVGRGVTIGEGAVIGPGAVILGNVAADARMFGNPARAVPGIPERVRC
jgi:sugar O-acyltransferase (sialic acid O-acetyltransferase NeuD family)